jgi:hypothetical protein
MERLQAAFNTKMRRAAARSAPDAQRRVAITRGERKDKKSSVRDDGLYDKYKDALDFDETAGHPVAKLPHQEEGGEDGGEGGDERDESINEDDGIPVDDNLLPRVVGQSTIAVATESEGRTDAQKKGRVTGCRECGSFAHKKSACDWST